MHARLCATACARTAASVCVRLPNLYVSICPCWSEKVFEFSASNPRPWAAACWRNSVQSVHLSHGTWGDTFQIEIEAGKLAVLDMRDMPKMLDWCLPRRRDSNLMGVSGAFRKFVLSQGAALAKCRL